jgi:hypothetical protein
MEDSNVTSLESMFSSQPAAESTEAASVEQTQSEQVEQPQAGTGEPQSAPPAEAQPEPDHVPRAAVIDERRKRQELERNFANIQREHAEMAQFIRQVQQAQQAQQAQQRQQSPQTQQQAPQGLSPEQFQSYEAYLEALADARAEAKAEAKVKQVLEEQMRSFNQEQRARALQHATVNDMADMHKAGMSKYADFNEVVGRDPRYGGPPITDVMANAMLVIDSGHEVAYHLGQNPAEAARIANLPPSSQAREIGRLAKQLAAPPAAPPAVNVPKTLTQTRSATGQFTKAYTGPTPLTDLFKR